MNPQCGDVVTTGDVLFRLGILALVVVPWAWFAIVQIAPWRRRS